jgi:hypothetical protein
MNKLIMFLVATAYAAAITVRGASYSTEATMTRQREKGTYEVIVRVSHLVEQGGKVIEELIEQPKITSAPGVPASLHCGAQPSDRDYNDIENVTVDVSWPEIGKQSFSVCKVVVKLGDKVVSRTKTRVTVEQR